MISLILSRKQKKIGMFYRKSYVTDDENHAYHIILLASPSKNAAQVRVRSSHQLKSSEHFCL